jgi:hypothetical protein
VELGTNTAQTVEYIAIGIDIDAVRKNFKPVLETNLRLVVEINTTTKIECATTVRNELPLRSKYRRRASIFEAWL